MRWKITEDYCLNKREWNTIPSNITLTWWKAKENAGREKEKIKELLDTQNTVGMNDGSSKLGWWTRTFDTFILTFGRFIAYYRVLALDKPLYDGLDALIHEEKSEHL